MEKNYTSRNFCLSSRSPGNNFPRPFESKYWNIVIFSCDFFPFCMNVTPSWSCRLFFEHFILTPKPTAVSEHFYPWKTLSASLKVFFVIQLTEAALQRWSWEKVFGRYSANLRENTHAEVWFQESCKAKYVNKIATLLKKATNLL